MQQKKYSCPMHPEVQSTKPGKCPKCGMELVLSDDDDGHVSKSHQTKFAVYRPLFIIVGLIFAGALSISFSTHFNLKFFLEYFMAGFFLVFSGFKLLDLKGFAEAYATYDLLARKIPMYGYIYPFIELFFGLAIILRFNTFTINLLIFAIMSFSGIGVLESLLKRRKFQCACLGTIIKVPLTHITLIEDFGMAGMALVLLLTG